MHELEVLLSRLKMEHLSYHVESLLEQAAKKELNYREFLCMALQQEWNGRHQRGMDSRLKKRWSSSTVPSSRASTVRLSGNWLVWRSWSAAKT